MAGVNNREKRERNEIQAGVDGFFDCPFFAYFVSFAVVKKSLLLANLGCRKILGSSESSPASLFSSWCC